MNQHLSSETFVRRPSAVPRVLASAAAVTTTPVICVALFLSIGGSGSPVASALYPVLLVFLLCAPALIPLAAVLSIAGLIASVIVRPHTLRTGRSRVVCILCLVALAISVTSVLV